MKVWGISANTFGPLVMYKGNINDKRYLKMFEDHLLEIFSQFKDTRTIKGSLIMQQDNSPDHIYKIVKQWLKNNNMANLIAQTSVSLRIFEYTYKMNSGRLRIEKKNRDDVWKETLKIWYTKVDNLLPKLYKSFPKRVSEVLINN